MPSPLPQPVLAPLTPAAIFLVATINSGGEAAVHDALPDLAGLVRAIGFRDPSKNLSMVTSIGSEAWDRLFSGPRPKDLHPFVELHGSRHHAPATPGDLLFHIRAEVLDVCFELAGRVVKAMAGAITIVDEVHGFKFFDNRDLLGFVDGTENPDGPLAVSASQIGDEDPDFAGGCYVHVQKYLHDMTSWDALSVTEQERVIGRTKLEDIEMPDDVKPSNSHIALNVISDDDGNELKIIRHNMPFGRSARTSSAPTTSATRVRPTSPRRCWRTCSSATRPATPTGSWTSPPRSPVPCSSRRSPISSTIRRRGRASATTTQLPRHPPLLPTAHWRSAA